MRDRNRRPVRFLSRSAKLFGALALLAALGGCVVYPAYGPPAVFVRGGCCWWHDHDWR